MPLLKSNDFWKPNTQYHATDRYKSLIENGNMLYICNESHLSRDVFDCTKFTMVSGTGGGQSGFNFGGEWDAVANENYNLAEFDTVENATILDNELIAIDNSEFWATSTALSQTKNISTGRSFRVTVPDTINGLFIVMIHNSTLSNPFVAVNDESAVLRGLAMMNGMPVTIIRDNSTFESYPIPYTINIGNVIRVEYRGDIDSVFIYNETENTTLYSQNFITGLNSTSPHLSIYGDDIVDSTLQFDFAPSSDYPLYQVNFSFNFPVDLTKTYRISDSSIDSLINNKSLQVGDFVNFIVNNNSVVDVVIYRLLRDDYIKSLILTELQDESSQIYNGGS